MFQKMSVFLLEQIKVKHYTNSKENDPLFMKELTTTLKKNKLNKRKLKIEQRVWPTEKFPFLSISKLYLLQHLNIYFQYNQRVYEECTT